MTKIRYASVTAETSDYGNETQFWWEWEVVTFDGQWFGDCCGTEAEAISQMDVMLKTILFPEENWLK